MASGWSWRTRRQPPYRPTENLRQAIVVLGLDAVLTASLSLTLINDRTSATKLSSTFRKQRWTRSVHAAACAQHLAEHVSGVSVDQRRSGGRVREKIYGCSLGSS